MHHFHSSVKHILFSSTQQLIARYLFMPAAKRLVSTYYDLNVNASSWPELICNIEWHARPSQLRGWGKIIGSALVERFF